MVMNLWLICLAALRMYVVYMFIVNMFCYFFVKVARNQIIHVCLFISQNNEAKLSFFFIIIHFGYFFTQKQENYRGFIVAELASTHLGMKHTYY